MTLDLIGCTAGPSNGLADIPGLGVGHAVRGPANYGRASEGASELDGATVGPADHGRATPGCTASAPECEGNSGHDDGGRRARPETGVTVIAVPSGATAGVDVRGGGPGTRETDVLRPSNTVQQVHAIVLSGGSAFGLDASSGAMAVLEAAGIGFPVLGPSAPDRVVPIVCSAVIFDLLVGQWSCRPDAGTGAEATRRALRDAASEPDSQSGASARSADNGNVGAGMGAVAGAVKGGFGEASAVFPALPIPADSPLAGEIVAAAIVTNPQGSVIDPRTGLLWGIDAGLPTATGSDEFAGYPAAAAWARDEYGRAQPLEAEALARVRTLGLGGTKFPAPSLNTAIGLVATTAPLTKAQAERLVIAAHDGLARAIRPAHLPLDGDTIFALSVPPAAQECDAGGVTASAMTMLSAVAAQCIERAVVHSVLGAESVPGVPSYAEVVLGDGGAAAGPGPSVAGGRSGAAEADAEPTDAGAREL